MKFKDQVLVVFRQMGGKGTPEEIFTHVRAHATEDDIDGWIRKGATQQIRSALRTPDPDTGLPFAPSVGDTYIQADQLELDDYAYLITAHRKRGDEAHDRVRKYQVRCQAVHDVWLNVADAQAIVDRQAGGA